MTGRIDGRECVILQLSATARGGARPIHEMWVDPSRDYCVVRTRTTSRDGDPRRQIDIEHRQDADGVWLPSGWEHVSLDPDGSTRSSDTTEVTRVEIGPLGAELFQIHPPAGTLVVDGRVNAGQQWVVRDDGSRYLIPADELAGKDFEEIVPRLRELAREDPFSWAVPGIAAGLAAIGLVVAARLWRRRAGAT
jgi:hypothetical protein